MTYLDRTWTWAQWNDRIRRAGRRAGRTRRRARRRRRVPGQEPPGVWELTLAAASLGAANAIINFRLAGDELDYVLNDSGAKVLIVGSELRPLIDKIRDKLDQRPARHRGHPGWRRRRRVRGAAGRGHAHRPRRRRRARRRVHGDVLEGTTGRPKGVALTQANVIAHTINALRRLGRRRRRQEHGGDAAVPCRWLVLRPVRDTQRRAQRDDAGCRRCRAGRRDPAGRQPDLPGARGAGQGAGVRRGRGQAVRQLKTYAYGASPMPLPLLRAALRPGRTPTSSRRTGSPRCAAWSAA